MVAWRKRDKFYQWWRRELLADHYEQCRGEDASADYVYLCCVQQRMLMRPGFARLRYIESLRWKRHKARFMQQCNFPEMTAIRRAYRRKKGKRW